MPYHYAWLVWASAFLLPWIVLYLANPLLRPVMWRASFATAVLGLSEPLFVPAYWNPPSLFELAQRTGFDIESLIFSFALGGVGVVLYNALTRTALARVPAAEVNHRGDMRPVMLTNGAKALQHIRIRCDVDRHIDTAFRRRLGRLAVEADHIREPAGKPPHDGVTDASVGAGDDDDSGIRRHDAPLLPGGYVVALAGFGRPGGPCRHLLLHAGVGPARSLCPIPVSDGRLREG